MGHETKPRVAGRQDAYRARTRAALLKSAQEVLADVGLSATIDDLASHAVVSPATIYNHFDSKDAFLKEALDQMWREAVTWAYDGKPPGESLQLMITVCRKLFRLNRTQTLFGRVLSKTLEDSPFVIDAVGASSITAFREAARNNGLEADDFDVRLDMWAFCLAGIFHGVFVSEKLSPQAADKALTVALSLWNLDKDHAEALTSQPLSV